MARPIAPACTSRRGRGDYRGGIHCGDLPRTGARGAAGRGKDDTVNWRPAPKVGRRNDAGSIIVVYPFLRELVAMNHVMTRRVIRIAQCALRLCGCAASSSL